MLSFKRAQGKGGDDGADRHRSTAHPTVATHQQRTLSPPAPGSQNSYTVQSACSIYSHTGVQCLVGETSPHVFRDSILDSKYPLNIVLKNVKTVADE